MPRYMVERTFPGDGLRIPVADGGAATCMGVVDRNAELGVTGVHSYVSHDKRKTFCDDALKNARDATAAYADPAAALASGYDLLTDSSDLACIDMPGEGGMGVHYVKGSLVQAGTIDAARPQALVYEVQSDGRLRLVALEYVAFQSAWDASHPTPQELFGQKFMLTNAGNRFGLPAFYSLHAWIYKRNPSGTFNPWNPTVRCGAPLRSDAGEAEVTMSAGVRGPDDPTFECPMPAVDADTNDVP